MVVAELRETSKNKRYLADCYKKSIMFHLFVMDVHVWKYLPQRTYSDLPHKRLEYVLVNCQSTGLLPDTETYWLQHPFP